MQSEKALDYIERLSNLNDKCYTRIVAMKAVKIALNEFSDELKAILELNDIDRIKNEISEIINE